MALRGTISVAIFLLGLAAVAQADSFNLGEPVVGFDGAYLAGHWVPLRTALHATEDPFRGTVTLTVAEGPRTRYRIVRTVSVAGGDALELDFIIPVPVGAVEVGAQVRESSGEARRKRWVLEPPERLSRIVLVVGRPGSFDLLRRIRGTMLDDARVVYARPRELPVDPLGYETLDTVVLYDAPLSEIPPAAVGALQTWVRRGGRVITLGGPHLSPEDAVVIHPLLPGRFVDFAVGMPESWNELFPLGIAGPGATVRYSRFEPIARARAVPDDEAPLITYEDRGKGSVEFVATSLFTLGRIAMPGSGVWREAFPSLSAAGRLRVATMADRRMGDTAVGAAVLLEELRLFPRRGTIALVGVAYIVVVSVVVRVLARSYRPPRAAVLLPAVGAVFLAAAMLLGAARGSWTTPAMVAEAELFRGSALAHGSMPTPGVIEKDIMIASRIGAKADIDLSRTLQPVPLAGKTTTVYHTPRGFRLTPSLGRREEQSYYLQSSKALAVTAEIHASSRGVRVTIRNRSPRPLARAAVLWDAAVFPLGTIERDADVSAPLETPARDRSLRRALRADRFEALKAIRERTTARTGPLLLAFFDQPLAPVDYPESTAHHSLSVGLFSLPSPFMHGMSGPR